jgi:hypothetical protein
MLRHLRRRLQGEEERQERAREFIRVLRLLEDYPMDRLRKAVEKLFLSMPTAEMRSCSSVPASRGGHDLPARWLQTPPSDQGQ